MKKKYHIDKEIEKIIDSIEKVTAGDFNVSIKLSNKEGRDQYNALVVGINMMVEEMKARTDELKSRVGELKKARLVLYSLAEDIQREKKAVEKKVKERTKELSIEHGKLQALLESIKLGVVMVDLNFNVVLANSAVKAILGKFPGENLSFKDIEGEIKNIDISQALSYYVQKGKPFNIQETKIMGKFFRLFLSPVRDIDKQEFIGAVIVMEDITEHKMVDRMKTEFISITSHQLRTPLTAIKLFLEMLASEEVGSLNKKQKEYIGELRKSTKGIIELVNDFLNVSRLESGKLEIKQKKVNIEKVIKDIIKELDPLAISKNCKIFFKSPLKLPKISIDASLISQVFKNVISNAIQYSTTKEKIFVKLKKEEKNYLIEIKNNGIGIPKEAQSKIFGRFFRADNALKMIPGGSGLGLYLTSMIMEAIGGKIWFKSQKEKSTIFYISLPIKGIKNKKDKKV